MKEVRYDDLAVRGVKVNVQRDRRVSATARNTSYNQFRVCSATGNVTRAAGNLNFPEYREVFRLRSAEIPKSRVETEQLREIRESVDIEDLRRLLATYGSDLKADRDGGEGSAKGGVVMCIDASKLHEEFYQNQLFDTKRKTLRKIMDCKCKPCLPNHIKTTTDLDRKVLRETLYSEIFQRHRRSIFALGSFLRMLKSKKSNYNVIKQEGESE